MGRYPVSSTRRDHSGPFFHPNRHSQCHAGLCAWYGWFCLNGFFLTCFFLPFSVGNWKCLLLFILCGFSFSLVLQPRRQALVIGSLVTMAFVGGMMAHTPFAYLNELFGWRKALLIDGAVGWYYYYGFSLWCKTDLKMLLSKQIQMGSVLANFTRALANPQNWLAGFFTSFLNLPIMVLCALWGTSYLQVVHHMSEGVASNVIDLIFMGSVIGCPLAGWLSDSQGHRKPLMVAWSHRYVNYCYSFIFKCISIRSNLKYSLFCIRLFYQCTGYFLSPYC